MALKIFGKRILAQKLLVKCWWNWLKENKKGDEGKKGDAKGNGTQTTTAGSESTTDKVCNVIREIGWLLPKRSKQNSLICHSTLWISGLAIKTRFKQFYSFKFFISITLDPEKVVKKEIL